MSHEMATRKVTKFRGENRRNEKIYFCEIVWDGTKVITKFGNTDPATGTTTITDRSGQRLASEALAHATFEKLIENRGKSYRDEQKRTEEEAPMIDETLDAGAFDPALEAEVAGAQDAASARAASTVYADWLQQQGDARGELAGLFLGGQEDEARAWLANNPTKLFGDLDVQLDTEITGLVWEHGFVRGASLKRKDIDSDTDLAELTRAFLALPVARLVTELRFGLAGYESDNDWTSTLAAVAESVQAKQLRVLRFDDYSYEDSEISWTAIGDFSGKWSSFPALEDLRIRSGEGGTLGDLALPNLKRFERVSGGLGEGEVREIFAATWPKLVHLDVWFGRSSYGAGGKPEHLAPLLDGRMAKSLVNLGLVNCEFVQDLIEPLAKSTILRQLKTLDLSKGTLTDADVDLFLKHADAFAHLDYLDLTENLMESRGAEIHARLPHAAVDGQREYDDERRYAALGE
jgi:hypothetical protein